MSRKRQLGVEEWSFLKELFNTLEENGVKCPILRNYEDLPVRIGNDLDIFVSRQDLAVAENVLYDLVKKHRGCLVKRFKKDSFTAWWLRIGEAPLLHIDLFNGAFYWRGRRFASDQSIIDNTNKHIVGFTIPRPAHQAFSMYVTSLIWGCFYQSKYGAKISDLLCDEREALYFQDMIQRNFYLAKDAPFDFTDKPDKEVVVNYVKLLRKSVRLRWLKRFNLKEAFAVARYWLWEFINLARPAGSWALVAEKSGATADELMKSEMMNLYGECSNIYYNGKIGIAWLWFRVRHVQRRMARNEFVFVHTLNDQIKSSAYWMFGRPDFVIVDNLKPDSLLQSKGYEKCERMRCVWVVQRMKHLKSD